MPPFRRPAPRLLATALLAATACSGESTSPGPVDPGPTESLVRVVNGSPYPLTVLREGTVVARDIPSGEYTNPLPIATAGPVTLALRRSGGAADVPVAFTARAGHLHSVVATAAPGQPVAARALASDASEPEAARGKLRVVHLAAEAPAVDVWYVAPGGGQATRLQPAPFPVGTESAYLSAIPGSWRVWVTPAGQAAPVLAEANAVLLGSGAVRTVALLPASEGVALRAFDDR